MQIAKKSLVVPPAKHSLRSKSYTDKVHRCPRGGPSTGRIYLYILGLSKRKNLDNVQLLER